MNAYELAQLDTALDAILARHEEKRVLASHKRQFRAFKEQKESVKGAYRSAAMLAFARNAADKASAHAFLIEPEEIPYQEIEHMARRMAFEAE